MGNREGRQGYSNIYIYIYIYITWSNDHKLKYHNSSLTIINLGFQDLVKVS